MPLSDHPDPASERIRIGCPGCDKPLNIRLAFVGQKVRCRGCRASFRVPERIIRPCPHCGQDLRFRTGLLGRKLICRHCGLGFVGRWAEPAEPAEDPIAGLQATDERVEALRAELKKRTEQFAGALQRLGRARARIEKYKRAAKSPPVETDPGLAEAGGAHLAASLEEARAALARQAVERDEAAREADDLRRALDDLRELQAAEAGERDVLRVRVEELTAEARSAREEAEGLRDALPKSEAAPNDDGPAPLLALEASLAEARALGEAARAERDRAREDLVRLESALRAAREERDTAERQAEALRGRSVVLNAEHDRLAGELTEARRLLDEAKAGTESDREAEAARRSVTAEAALADLRAERDRLAEARDALGRDLGVAHDRAEALARERDDARGEAARLGEAHRTEVEALGRSLDQSRREAKAAASDLGRAEVERDAARREAEGRGAELAEADAARGRAEAALADLRAERDRLAEARDALGRDLGVAHDRAEALARERDDARGEAARLGEVAARQAEALEARDARLAERQAERDRLAAELLAAQEACRASDDARRGEVESLGRSLDEARRALADERVARGTEGEALRVQVRTLEAALDSARPPLAETLDLTNFPDVVPETVVPADSSTAAMPGAGLDLHGMIFEGLYSRNRPARPAAATPPAPAPSPEAQEKIATLSRQIQKLQNANQQMQQMLAGLGIKAS